MPRDRDIGGREGTSYGLGDQVSFPWERNDEPRRGSDIASGLGGWKRQFLNALKPSGRSGAQELWGAREKGLKG